MNKFKILKSTKKILIATNNPGKFKEIKELLPQKIRYFKPKDFNMKEPVENGIITSSDKASLTEY